MIRRLVFSFVFTLGITAGSSLFIKEQLCHINDRVSHGCSREVTGARSLFDCVLQCGIDDSCTGATLEEEDKLCYLHGQCPSVAVCAEGDESHDNWSRYCEHGDWDSSTRACKCVDGFFGERCEKYPQDCNALTSAGYPGGMHRITLDPLQNGVDLMKVVCDTTNPSKMKVVMLMNTGGMDVNRTWSEYVNGFYEDVWNHWGGLEPWYVLSNAGCDNMKLHLHFKIGESLTLSYSNSKLSKDVDNYQFAFMMAFSEMSSDSLLPSSYQFRECMYPLRNTNFSTWDRDNDESASENCAALAGSGWWYSGCVTSCNFLGWGLDNWQETPSGQRLLVPGVDMNEAAPDIAYFKMDITC